MNDAQRALWTRLEVFRFDPAGTSLTFARRLARENGWTISFAEKVIREYLRFVFLAMEAGHPVSPAEAVDQAWHLHLTYTRSYWQELCGDVLGRRLHHHPTKGGADEANKFDGQYRQTLESYRRIFGEEPPADIWVAADNRQHLMAGGHRWVDTQTHWVVPKWFAWTALAVAGTGMSALVLSGCSSTELGMLGLFDLPGPEFLSVFVLIAIAGIVLAVLARFALCGPHDLGKESAQLADAYELAYLAGGGPRVLQTALISLHAAGTVGISRGASPSVRRTGVPAHDIPDVEALVWGALPESGQATGLETISAALHPYFERVEARLRAKRLWSADASLATGIATGILLVAPLLGVVKIFVGLSRGRPVSFLVVLVLIAAGLAAGLFVTWRRQKRSVRGDRLLRAERKKHLSGGGFRQGVRPEKIPLRLATALFGLAVLPAYGYAGVLEVLRPAMMYHGSSCGTSCGGGSGCGGGGCGSGCGGCGGSGGD